MEFNPTKNTGVTIMTRRQMKMGIEKAPVILYTSHVPKQWTTA
jgi:hypothetical protein